MTQSSKSNNKQKPNSNRLTNNVKFEAIGTYWSIEINQEISETELTILTKLIKKRINDFDLNYSRFRSDSLVSKMAKNPGKYKLPEDAKPLFDLYKKLYEISEGLVTPLIGNLISEAGYDANYSFKTKKLNKVPKWEEALNYNYPNLELKKSVLLDIGAAGKGYLVDIISELILRFGISDFVVNAGGDIIQKSKFNKVERIGLEHPINLDEVIGIATISNQSICGSSGNRRSWSSFNHIINPKTKTSPKNILAVWVIADTTLVADGLATTLFFIDADIVHKYFKFEFALIFNDLSIEYSNKFPAEIFS